MVLAVRSFLRVPLVVACAVSLLTSVTPVQANRFPAPDPPATSPPVTRFALTASWPMSGHDAAQSYADPVGSIAPASVPLVHLRWQADGLTPQIESGGTVYATDATGRVSALESATGTSRYKFQTTGVVGIAYQDPLLYFNRSSEIRFVDAKTANWNHTATDTLNNLVSSFESVIVSGPRVYTGAGPAAAGSLARYYAFDALTGRQLWQRDGSATSVPCLSGNTLYLSFGNIGNADSYLLDPAIGFERHLLKSLGATQWNASGSTIYASVLSGGGGSLRASIRAYTGSGHVKFVAHDVLFGAALPDMLFGIVPGAVDARSAADGHRLWRSQVPGLVSITLGSVAVSGNLVIVQAADGRISLLDRDTGATLMKLRPPFAGAGASNLLVGGGIIFESVGKAIKGGKAGPPTLLAFGP
jgi:outer membrane protein assembly factor BamB